MQAQPTMGIAMLTAMVVLAALAMGFALLITLAVVLIRNPAQAPKIIGGVALGGLALVLFAATFFVGIRQSHHVRQTATVQASDAHQIHWNDRPRVTTQRVREPQVVETIEIAVHDDGHAPAEPQPAPVTPAAPAKVVEHTSNLLWARQQASDAPAWASVATSLESPFVVVSTDPYATEEEATRLQLTPRVVTAVTQKLYASFPAATGARGVPVELINQYGVREIVREEFQKDFGLGKPEPMYKLHARVEVTPELKQAVHRLWKDSLVNERLWQLGGATGLSVLVVALAAGFLRLNAIAVGRSRKVLAVVLGASVIGAGLLGVLLLS